MDFGWAAPGLEKSGTWRLGAKQVCDIPAHKLPQAPRPHVPSDSLSSLSFSPLLLSSSSSPEGELRKMSFGGGD